LATDTFLNPDSAVKRIGLERGANLELVKTTFKTFRLFKPSLLLPRIETVSQLPDGIDVILSASEESLFSGTYRREILRLASQDDITVQSRRGGGNRTLPRI
jgi:hypothetical protein